MPNEGFIVWTSEPSSPFRWLVSLWIIHAGIEEVTSGGTGTVVNHTSLSTVMGWL